LEKNDLAEGSRLIEIKNPISVTYLFLSKGVNKKADQKTPLTRKK